MVKVEPITHGRLRVWLSDEEAAKWGLPDNEESARRLVRRVLRVTGWPPSTGLTAELFPVAGGWLLLLSNRADTERGQPRVYRLADADALCGLAEMWCRLFREASQAPRALLYEEENGYLFVVYPAESLPPAVSRLQGLTGQPIAIGLAAAAAAAEHGHLLGDERALHILGGYRACTDATKA